jgi:hypothetical protein
MKCSSNFYERYSPASTLSRTPQKYAHTRTETGLSAIYLIEILKQRDSTTPPGSLYRIGAEFCNIVHQLTQATGPASLFRAV